MTPGLQNSQIGLAPVQLPSFNAEIGSKQKTEIDQAIRSFYLVANSVISKIGRIEERERKLILLICGNPATLGCIDQYLQEANLDCEILTSATGKKAYDLAVSVVPDLIIANWPIPEIDGLELVSLFKTNSVTRSIPLIMITNETGKKEVFNNSLDAFKTLDWRENNQSNNRIETVIGSGKNNLEIDQSEEEKITSLENIYREEKERHKHHMRKLQAQLEFKQREVTMHLELLIHSRNVKEKLIEGVNKLQPYLTIEGKPKLYSLLRQLERDLHEEAGINSEKMFDELNAGLYAILEKLWPEITKNEKRLCAYLKLNHGATDIARITNRSLNSVNVGFARLRAKLGLPNTKDLRIYLNEVSMPNSAPE